MRQLLSILILPALVSGIATAQNIFTITGIPYTHRNDVDQKPALQAPLGNVYGILIDKQTGRLILNDEILVLRREPDDSLLTLAGSGAVFNPPNAGATLLGSSLRPYFLRGMAQDSKGNLYFSDAGAGRVYRLAADGAVTTFAGGGTAAPGFASDGGLATAASLPSPRGLVFDSKGNLDIAEVYCNCIRRVTPDGIISTVYTLPPAGRYLIQNIEGLAIDAQDNIYFTTWVGDTVGEVASDGSGATILAGTGSAGFSGDGGPAQAAQLSGPSGVALDSSGNIYIADTMNNRIREITKDGIIHTIAGSSGTCGFLGDGRPALRAQLCRPAEVIFDNSGNILIADYGNQRVRSVAGDGTITTIAGSGQFDPALSSPYSGTEGDGGPPIHAVYDQIGGAAFDAAGNLFISETQKNVIREISADGTVSTCAGIGVAIDSGDGGPAKQAGLIRPGPLSVGPDGTLYIVTGDDRIRSITPDGIMHTVAGSGPGSGADRNQGDGGPAVDATLNEPGAAIADAQGNVYIADTSNARVRKVDSHGIITTVAGPAQPGSDYFNAVAIDGHNSLYVSWTHLMPAGIYATVNRVNPDGSLTRVAGNSQVCTNGPGQWPGDGPALQARLCAVTQMSTGPDGLLYLSEGSYGLVLRLNADGSIQRVAGNTSATLPRDGGPALQASLQGGQGFSPEAVTFDPAGHMFIPEPGLNLVREVIATPYKLSITPVQITANSQTILVTGNFAEPFPYQIVVTTDDGGSWLRANRDSAVTGETFTLTTNTAGLSPGVHYARVAVIAPLTSTVAPEIDLDIPITVAP